MMEQIPPIPTDSEEGELSRAEKNFRNFSQQIKQTLPETHRAMSELSADDLAYLDHGFNLKGEDFKSFTFVEEENDSKIALLVKHLGEVASPEEKKKISVEIQVLTNN